MTWQPAIRRTAKWWQDRAERQEQELRQLIWPNGVPQQSRSPAQKLYPNLTTESSWRSVEIARRPDSKQKTVGSVVYPHLRSGGN